MPDSIQLHLESCRAWSRGKGAPQSEALIQRRLQFENLVHSIDSDHSWRITDESGAWFCPCCQERVPQVRMPTGHPLSSFTYQAVADHLSRCASWQQGSTPTASQIERTRSRAACMPQLMTYVSSQLQSSLWRYVDPMGQWVCPYCISHLSQVRVVGTDWTRSIEGIAQHLLCRCPPYAIKPGMTLPEDQVRQSAGTTGQIPGATPSGAVPIQRPVRSVTTATPVRQSLQTPSTSVPIATPLRTARTPSSILTNTPVTTQGLPPVAPPAAPKVIPSSEVEPDSIQRLNTPAWLIEDDLEPEVIGDVEPPQQQLDWMDDVEQTNPGPVPPTSLHERTDRMLARDLQQTLLQEPPKIDGVSFGVAFEACADISGDFYEFINLPDGRTGFAIGDVSGHGMQAGLIMSMAKKTLEIYASLGSGPADTLARVNDALHRDLGGKMFVSLVYAVLDPIERTITWARAGHNPPFHLSKNGISEIRPAGMVVGMKHGPAFRTMLKEEVTTLESGDCFLIFTDGITESMNLQHEEFSEDRLKEVMQRYAGEGPQALATHIMDLVRQFRGPQPQADDMTLLAVAIA